jgi:hypothetical protein
MKNIVLGAFLILVGAVCIALFIYLNLNVQPRLFPGEVSSKGGAAAPRRVQPISHLSFGVMIGALFFLGVALVSLGSAIIATTLGYGRG